MGATNGSLWPNSVIVLPPITRFALMTDRKNQDGIVIFLKAIQGNITRASSGYHQLSQAMLDGTAYQWMTNQQFNGFLNQSKRLSCRGRICLDQEVG